MSAIVRSSVRISASTVGRAPVVERRGGVVARPAFARAAKSVARGGVRLASRGSLVVRADGSPPENPNLDRENPELEEKFAIIGWV
jgi:hypothetical protein